MENKQLYKARFQHFGAMIEEMRILIDNYNPNLKKKEWIKRVIRENLLGKSSRTWVRELVNGVFFPRFVDGIYPNTWYDIKYLSSNNVDFNVLKSLMYYFTVLSDKFIYDYISKDIFNRYYAGQLSISANDVYQYIQNIPAEQFNKPWSDYVKKRLSRGIMATLRDFDLLQGKANKKISNYYLPFETFLYVAFLLKQSQFSGIKLIHHSDWKLFLLNPKLVERLFMEAQQQKYLQYDAAGSIVKIEFSFSSKQELLDAIVRRPIRNT